jgi:hypothetical protein
MPIRLRRYDKNRVEAHQSDISAVREAAMLFSQASYTAIKVILECYKDQFK